MIDQCLIIRRCYPSRYSENYITKDEKEWNVLKKCCLWRLHDREKCMTWNWLECYLSLVGVIIKGMMNLLRVIKIKIIEKFWSTKIWSTYGNHPFHFPNKVCTRQAIRKEPVELYTKVTKTSPTFWMFWRSWIRVLSSMPWNDIPCITIEHTGLANKNAVFDGDDVIT